MQPRRFVICDIEATGLDQDKEIIEIALITYQDGKVIEVWESLVNPLRPVSEFIRDLTSISMRELNEAPKFYDIADSVKMRLENAVFVSHNTDFDYQLLQKKFKEMGQDLKIKTFCTLKVAQAEIPGLRNYNLDALCSFFGIKISDRHRAIGDAKATLELFKELETLRSKVQTRILFLPHHEKLLKQISSKAGLLFLKDEAGKTIHLEAAQNMERKARELLMVKPENRQWLINTHSIEAEVTGSPLIAEFKKLLKRSYRPHWTILMEQNSKGEKHLKVFPLKKGMQGLWYFKDLLSAKRKVKELYKEIPREKFAYRDGGKSKEEIFRHNQKIEALTKLAKFPNENLIILGDGRTMGEKSLILVRDGHVIGHGYSEQNEDIILQNPEEFISHRYNKHLGVDIATKRYIRELKNMRQKSDGWRSLAVQ
jgi:DNA polymerase-3 subunit epsilon